MENSDKPIYPCTIRSGDSFAETNQAYGLTKREYFAGLAMQGFISNIDGIYSPKEVIKLSIEMGDELLKQLEKS